MSENKVLALKYRPRRFEDLVGQSTISQTLSLALDSNRLSHAYLFSGLRGSGKTSTARIMAKALLCSNGPTSRPCETCENCQSSNSNKHLDIIEMDAASNRGIDDIKDLIEHTKYKPSSARFKVFIIDEVHMLTTPAFNALLKTLEEPPGFVKFILATTDPLKLPATILSRTQHFRFNKIAQKDVLHHLTHILNEESIEFDTSALDILARSGQGSLRDTLTLLDQAIIFSKGKITISSVVDMLGLIEPKLMDELFDIILKKEDFLSIFKELENYEISQVIDEMTIYLKQKMLDKDAKFNVLLFDRFFRILSDAKHLLTINSDGGFVLILTLSKMIEATRLKTIDEIINEVEQIEVKEPVQKVVKETPKIVVDDALENATLSLDSIDAISKVEPLTPFDDSFIPTSNTSQIIEEISEPVIEENLEEIKVEERVIEEQPIEEEPIKEEIIDPNIEAYKNLISKIYERDYELGEAFEKNFIYKSFENNKLEIDSYAIDKDRAFLLKHYGVIKLFIYDIFGQNIDIEFIKKENDLKKDNFQSENESATLEESDEKSADSIEKIEDEIGAGCVADMNKVSHPKPSQKELELNDILNSSQLNTVKELFHIKKITVKTKT